MRVLFAAPDRDLLACCRQLLEADLGETVTAFDGARALSLLGTERFDAAVFDRDLPRIGTKVLLERTRDAGVPAIVLINEPISVRLLTEDPLPSAFLAYPFPFDRLRETLADVTEKTCAGERLAYAGMEIDVAGFRIAGGPSLTAEEIDVLRALEKQESVPADRAPFVSALNAKFARLGLNAGIRYCSQKGFTGYET